MELTIVAIGDIEVEERARESLGDIFKLVRSIKSEGLIQPLAVERRNNKYLLLAGGRRYEAAKKAGLEEVPVRVYESGLSSLKRKSIELAENICREDLMWQEEVKLKRSIHKLQIEIYGKKTSTAKDAPGWSKRDTSKMLGESPGSTILDIQLAEAIEVVPALSKAKDKAEARKLLKKLGRDMAVREIAQRVEEKRAKTPLESRKLGLINGYIVKDFFEGIKSVESGMFNIIEVDPPYAIDLINKKKTDDSIKIGTIDYNEIDSQEYRKFIRKVIEECWRVMTPESWMIFWFGPEPWFDIVWNEIKRVGFEVPMIPAIWYKGGGQTMQPAYRLANSYEMFFYARKGHPAIVSQGKPNVFHYAPVNPSKKSHPTEKPVELMEGILRIFGTDLSRLLVPFLGSGNTLLAASNIGMSGFGFDLGQENKDRYVIRVEEGKPGEYRSYA